MTPTTRYLLPLLIAAGLLWPVSLLAQDATPTAIPVGPTLRTAQARGQVICGVDQEVFGFGFLNANTGDVSGIYIDLCRALAAAILSEANAVDIRFQPLDVSPEAIFEDELDVMFSHGLSPTLTNITASPNVAFSPAVIFYDGASLLVSAVNEVNTWEDLEGETICVPYDVVAVDAQTGEAQTVASANALDFAEEMAARGLNYDESAASSIAELRQTFLDGRCLALVEERSLLEIIRQSTESPDSFAVWPATFNRRTISPLYARGDAQWANIVDWTMWALIAAEQQGITSRNIDEFLRREGEPDEAYLDRVGQSVARLLDPQLGLGGRIGLDNDFLVEVIRQVGNYAEIYERHLGPGSPLAIERSFNALWSDGGLLHTPDWR